ncbi:MAG: hypothetical protein ACRDHE_16180 [Ktedonobacterales bacterium]
MPHDHAEHASERDDPRLGGMRDLARVALQGRYGSPLDIAIVAALATADEATLNDILFHLTTDVLIDLRRRLGIEK